MTKKKPTRLKIVEVVPTITFKCPHCKVTHTMWWDDFEYQATTEPKDCLYYLDTKCSKCKKRMRLLA